MANISVQPLSASIMSDINMTFLMNLSKRFKESPACDFRTIFCEYDVALQNVCSSVGEEAHKLAERIDTPTQTVERVDEPAKRLESFVETVRLELRDGLTVHRTQGKTRNHISWDEYFLSVALLAAKRSKDPSTKVGACIVNSQKRIIATGYNGMPNGVHDDLVPWTKEGDYLSTKYAYVVHAELNAILNCVSSEKAGCKLYVTLFPCNECAKAVIQSGIRHLIYLSDKHKDKDITKAAKTMFQMSGVRYERYFDMLA